MSIKKAQFVYKKEDGSVSNRTIIRPSFLKEATNSLKDFDKNDVKYLHGIEILNSGMSQEEIAKYEKLVEEYLAIEFPTLEQFLQNNGLDPKKVVQKSFKKDGISNLQIL